MTCHKIVSAMNAHLSDGPVDLLMSGHGGRAMLSGVLFVCVCVLFCGVRIVFA